MYRKTPDDHYVHSALFKDIGVAKTALREVDAAGLSTERLALSVFGGAKMEPIEDTLDLPRGDGGKRLLLGLLMGALVGLLLSVVCVRFLLPTSLLEPAALCGLLGGLLLGGLGGAIHGLRHAAISQPRDEPLPQPASCLIIARTFELATIVQVEEIFKKHRLLTATH